MENYHIYDEIGRGTDSFVYKARRKQSIEYVAVKSTTKSRMDKILNEVPFLHKLNSRYVVRFYDWYESSNHIWLILEYCMGGDLLNLITQDKQLPESVVKSFGSELVAGLQYLHANSILYCDLKPANILIDEFGSLKLADFGLARRVPEIHTTPTPSLAPGSPHYMAPELFQQNAVHSFASDFWALGCVLFELRTGRQPFTHGNFSQLARMIQTDAVEFSILGCDMSLEFRDLLERLLVKDPYQRITWKELVDHPFWDNLPRLENVIMPVQELFDKKLPVSLNDLSTKDGNLGNSRRANKICTEQNETENCSNTRLSDDSGIGDQRPQRENDAAATDCNGGVELLESGALNPNTAIQVDTNQDAVHDKTLSASVRMLQTRSLLNSNDDFGDDFQDDYSEVSSQLAELRDQWRMTSAPHSVPRAIRQAPTQSRHLSSMFDQSGVSGSWLCAISELVFTAADCRVKSIIEYNDIKLNDLPRIHAKLHQFTLTTPEDLLSCATETLENQLKEIYVSLKSLHADIAEELSCMAYLFSLSCHTRLAHVIVNSSILKLLIHMLVQEARLPASHKTMLSMLCLVLGILFPSATVVTPSSPDQLRLLVKTLSDIVSSPSGNIADTKTISNSWLQSRSLALACLGESLYYISTQQEWEVPLEGVKAVLGCIEDPDIVARFYALRTLHNMLNHCPKALLPKLLSENFVLTLIRGLLQSADRGLQVQSDLDEQRLSDALRTNTTEVLAHILRYLCSPSSSAQLPSRLKLSLALHFANPNTLKAVWRGVESRRGSADLTIASLNIINAFLDMKLGGDRDVEYTAIKLSRTFLLERIIALPTIQRILELNSATDGTDEGLALMQAKSLITLHLGIQLNREFLTSFVRSDALTLVEQVLARVADRLGIDENNLVLQSPEYTLSAFEMYLTQCAVGMCKLVIRMASTLGADCFSLHESDRDEGRSCNHAEDLTRVLPISLLLFSGLLQNPNCRQHLFHYLVASNSKQYAFFLRLMAMLLASYPEEVLIIPGEPEITMTIARFVSEILLGLFQLAVAEVNEIVLVEKQIMFTHLLPAVVKHISGDLESNDEHVAVTCLRILYVVLLDFDYDNDNREYEFYDPFVRSLLLPHLSKMLKRRDTEVEQIWSLSSELLFGLLSSDSSLLSEAEDLDLVPTVVGLLAVPVQFNSLPSHATELVQMLMESVDVDLNLLLESGIAQSIAAGLTFAARQNKVDGALVGLVLILLNLLHHQFKKMRQQGIASDLAEFDDLVAFAPLLLQFCARSIQHHLNGKSESLLPEKDTISERMTHGVAILASRCLVLLSQISREQLIKAIFTQDKSDVSVLSSIFSYLQTDTSDDDMGGIVLHVLLTLKHCLRCQGNNTSLVSQWVTNNGDCLNTAKASASRKTPLPTSKDHSRMESHLTCPTVSEQISKAVAAIVSLCSSHAQ
ncbi:unnamed protein product [Peronospora belbahrii]|uniref:Protein kinase domain-containing protein n=1 Tax=Peronospora belbahrii TaxID=622444 RepID=A0ABN8CT38_9STRA|nr:unnamed protein product [Peronospora belbahrii]